MKRYWYSLTSCGSLPLSHSKLIRSDLKSRWIYFVWWISKFIFSFAGHMPRATKIGLSIKKHELISIHHCNLSFWFRTCHNPKAGCPVEKGRKRVLRPDCLLSWTSWNPEDGTREHWEPLTGKERKVLTTCFFLTQSMSVAGLRQQDGSGLGVMLTWRSWIGTVLLVLPHLRPSWPRAPPLTSATEHTTTIRPWWGRREPLGTWCLSGRQVSQRVKRI